MFSHKTGWWSFYTYDAGIVEDGKIKYVLVVFTPIKDGEMNGRMIKGRVSHPTIKYGMQLAKQIINIVYVEYDLTNRKPRTHRDIIFLRLRRKEPAY